MRFHVPARVHRASLSETSFRLILPHTSLRPPFIYDTRPASGHPDLVQIARLSQPLTASCAARGDTVRSRWKRHGPRQTVQTVPRHIVPPITRARETPRLRSQLLDSNLIPHTHYTAPFSHRHGLFGLSIDCLEAVRVASCRSVERALAPGELVGQLAALPEVAVRLLERRRHRVI